MLAETQGAVLYATKSAIVNGNPVSKTTAIFPGDKLSVPANSAATISLKGSSILVPMNSSIVFNGTSIELEPQTAVSVATTLGLAAQIANIKISPAANGNTRYQVARFNGQVVVAAKTGSVLIAGGFGNKVVPEGTTTSVPDPTPQKPGAIPAASGVGVGEIPGWVAALIGVAAAGAAAAAAIATTGKPVSNVHP